METSSGSNVPLVSFSVHYLAGGLSLYLFPTATEEAFLTMAEQGTDLSVAEFC